MKLRLVLATTISLCSATHVFAQTQPYQFPAQTVLLCWYTDAQHSQPFSLTLNYNAKTVTAIGTDYDGKAYEKTYTCFNGVDITSFYCKGSAFGGVGSYSALTWQNSILHSSVTLCGFAGCDTTYRKATCE